MQIVSSPRDALRSLGRAGAAVQNALEIARFGGLATDLTETSAYEVTAHLGIGSLRRYGSGASDRPAILLVPPLMLTAEVWDVSPATSAVAALAGMGVDPWVVDFGSPEEEAGGLGRNLADHVLTVDRMIDQVNTTTGQDVHLAGYSQGGMFCYQAAALRRSEGVASVVTFGSPVDIHRGIPFGLPAEWLTPTTDLLARTVLERVSIPGWASRTGFKLLDPVKSIRHRVDFLRQLADRESLLAREPQRRFLDRDGFIAYPGPALAEVAEQFIVHNRMLSGGFVIDDRLVTLADITCPILVFVGEVDELGRPAAVRAIADAAPQAEVYERSLHAGHFALVVGSTAREITWPTVAAWVHHQTGTSGDSRPPEHLAPVDPTTTDDDPGFHLGYGLDLFANVGWAVARSLADTVTSSVHLVRAATGELANQLPRLSRLERTESNVRLSLGKVLDEQATRVPEEVCFLFDDRAYTFAQVKQRIDAVVRGLLHHGVRHGDHVGVLMAPRPSALATVVALNRIGAVAVLLRPDGALPSELEIGEVTRVVTDPEHASLVCDGFDRDVLVLGGAKDRGHLPDGLIDLERIEPAEIDLPAWYQPNPGLAGDIAHILFTGEGPATRPNRVTNRRWALSAYGTASAARLSRRDTVYSLSPLHHPSGLLTAVGAAVAGTARLALAPSFDPGRFWEEVRRYGVTVVSYTWAMLQPLLAAPPRAEESHHSIRLFVGSGMPVGLWRDALRRFAPAQVLEFYASTEGEAAMVNLTGRKVGCKGRPLPGSADVEIAAVDLETGELATGDDGLAQPCQTDEVGLLVSRSPVHVATSRRGSLRGVFAAGDAWLATGDLFRRDADGDHWLVDRLETLTHKTSGPVLSVPIEDALGMLPAVELAVAFGLTREHDDPLVVACITVRDDVETTDLDRAFKGLDVRTWPDVVRIVPEIPLTTWYKPRREALRQQGLPDDHGWCREDSSSGYVPLSAERRAELLPPDPV